MAENDALYLKGDRNLYDARIYDLQGEFSVVEISGKEMVLSGTTKYVEYFDGYYTANSYSDAITLENGTKAVRIYFSGH